MSFKVGERVVVDGVHAGTVRYVGRVSGSTAPTFGVELDKPRGTSNGMHGGSQYFACAQNHGTFVPANKLRKLVVDDFAARKIQGAARMSAARMRVAKEQALRIFNALDNDDEHLHLERRRNLEKSGLQRPERQPIMRTETEEQARTEDDYAGPTISFPSVPMDDVRNVIAHFQQGNILHYSLAAKILLEAREVFRSEPTVQKVHIADDETLTIVGDTHGQLQDLYTIFALNGLPTAKNKYLFNGDFVDRGPRGVEIVLTIFLLKLSMPKSVFVNRGNHEERSQNEVGGFLKEVMLKYQRISNGRAARLYDMFETAFDVLPLACLITAGRAAGAKVFCVHGGLCKQPDVTLEDLQAIRRDREIPWGRQCLEDELFEDLMWSDPLSGAGWANSTRGAGILFGEDVTRYFCENNGIDLIVRSHECAPEGYEFQHGGLLVTVFSASRYCGRGTNSGAFMKFDSELCYNLQQFVAGTLDTCEPVAPDVALGRRQLRKQEEVVRSMLVERIVLRKTDLLYEFTNLDTACTGLVSRLQWSEAMTKVLRLELPWLSLCDKLASVQDDGLINYSHFLERYGIEMTGDVSQWQEELLSRVCAKLYPLCDTLEQAYNAFDTSGDGNIDFKELVNGIEALDVGLTKTQLYELMRCLDGNGDGRIDFSEFKAGFESVFVNLQSGGTASVLSPAASDAEALLGTAGQAADGSHKPVPGGSRPAAAVMAAIDADPWVRDTLERVGQAMFQFGGNAAEVFAALDRDNNGLLDFEEFSTAMSKLHLHPPLQMDDVRKLLQTIDVQHTGTVNYLEFLHTFRMVLKEMLPAPDTDTAVPSAAAAAAESPKPGTGRGSASWQQRLLESVIAILYEYRVELRSAFEMFDTNGDGKVSAAEFTTGLKALAGSKGRLLTDEQAGALLSSLDADKDGALDYEEFLSGFQLVDRDGGKDDGSGDDEAAGGRAGSPSGGGGGGGTAVVLSGEPLPLEKTDASGPVALRLPTHGRSTSSGSGSGSITTGSVGKRGEGGGGGAK